MKRKGKLCRLLTVGVVFFAALTVFTACGGQNADTSSGPVTITTNQSLGTDFETKTWYARFQKELNIKLEFMDLDSEQLNLLLSSGNLPDITRLPQAPNMTLVSSIIQADAALDLEPYLQTKLPSFLVPAYAPINALMKEYLGGPDKKLYFASNYVGGAEGPEGGTMSSRGYIVRWDYFKEIGAPTINNDDDFLAALRAMQANHPTTRDGKKTYAIAIENNFRDIGGYRAATTRADIALNVWTFGSTLYATDSYTGQPVNGFTDVGHSHYWADMRFYNKVYRAGLWDPDILSLNYDEYEAKIAEGTYMGLHYMVDTLYGEEVKLDPQTNAKYVVVPSTGAVVFANKLELFGRIPQDNRFIPKTTKNRDKALEALNFFYDPDNNRHIISGEKGVYWDYDASGRPYLFENAITERRARTVTPAGPGGYHTTYAGTAIHPDGYYINLFEEKEARIQSLTPAYQDFCKFYGVSYPGEAPYKLFLDGKVKDLSNDYGQSIASFIVIPTDLLRTTDGVIQIYERAMPRLIQAGTDAEFLQIQNQVLQEARSAGEDTVWQWITAEYARLEKIIYPLFLKAREAYVHK